MNLARDTKSYRNPDTCSFVATITLYLLAACPVRATQFLISRGGEIFTHGEKKKTNKLHTKEKNTRNIHDSVFFFLILINYYDTPLHRACTNFVAIPRRVEDRADTLFSLVDCSFARGGKRKRERERVFPGSLMMVSTTVSTSIPPHNVSAFRDSSNHDLRGRLIVSCDRILRESRRELIQFATSIGGRIMEDRNVMELWLARTC